jgi:ribonucleoside-diphosphate reductase alpha chain
MRGDTAGPVAEPGNGNGGGNGVANGGGGNGATVARGGSAKARPAASALTDDPPVIPAKLQGMDLGPACGQCGGMMQRTGSCYTCSSCGNNTGCG